MIRVVVSTPTTIRFEGRHYGPGDTFEVPNEVARKWVAAGWVKAASEGEVAERGLTDNEAGPEQMMHHRRNTGAA